MSRRVFVYNGALEHGAELIEAAGNEIKCSPLSISLCVGDGLMGLILLD